MSVAPRRSVVIGLVQMAMAESREENDSRAEAGIREAAEKGARIVCLPELYRSRYFCQSEDSDNFVLAEPVPGPTTKALGALSRDLGITLVASLFERRAAGVYHNTAVVIGPSGEVVGTYRKMHIPDDPRYYEKFYFTPGDTGFRVFAAADAEIGVLICWDQWYPEAARMTALMGAEILVYPTAIGWHPEEKAALGNAQHDAWQTIQRSHAIANGCFVVAVNRCGFEPGPDGGGIEFWGRSFVAAPDGTVVVEDGVGDSEVLIATLELEAIERQRQGWPFLRDRRIDAYGGLTERLLRD